VIAPLETDRTSAKADSTIFPEIAAMLSVDVQFEIQGDVGALPWIGRKTGRTSVADFIRDKRRLIEQLRFDVQDILASDDRAPLGSNPSSEADPALPFFLETAARFHRVSALAGRAGGVV
jgi:hypothetical protein